MATRNAPTRIDPTLSPERAIKALSKQIEDLQKLKGLGWEEGEQQEGAWQTLTLHIIEAAFGKPSTSIDRFNMATLTGSYGYAEMGDDVSQKNYDSRIRDEEGCLKGLIETLRLQLPEEDIKAVYDSGDEYAFYRDLSSLVAVVTQDILIVDAYLDEQLFNLYISKVAAGAAVRILSGKLGANVVTIAKMYASNRPLELRTSASVHDRIIFLDQRGWVIGQSIKDAARTKPTYMVELSEPLLTASRNVYGSLWAAATVVV